MSELPPHAAPDDERLELAALYALGALDEDERRAVERQRAGDAAFWAEVHALAPSVEQVAREADTPVTPGRDLFGEIRRRLHPASGNGAATEGRSQVWKRWAAESGAETVRRADEEAFEPTDVPGIRVRRLFVDVAADRVTMLVRMAAGTAYPAHRHGGPEECFVLEGDLAVGADVELHSGDYQRMDAGSRHPVQSTRGGCLLLITGSRHDELLAG